MPMPTSCIVTEMAMPILSYAVACQEPAFPQYSCGFLDFVLTYPTFYEEPRLSRRSVIEEHEEIREKVETLHGVVSRLLERGHDLDPEFVEIVDRNFWDLLL